MKLLENTEFEALSSKLSTETGVSKIDTRFVQDNHFYCFNIIITVLKHFRIISG